MDTIRTYFLETMLETALRDAQGVFPHPYLVPGGSGYSHTMWDWDAFFLGIGLLSARPEYAHYLSGTAKNFLHCALPDGFIPTNIEADGGGFISLTRQGLPMSPAKPVLAGMLAVAARAGGTVELCHEEWETLKRFVEFWKMHQQHPSGLFLINSHRGSGADNDPAVYGRPTRSTAPTLMNALMVRELDAMAYLAEKLEPGVADSYRIEAASVRAGINERMWDDEDAMYYSQDASYQTPNIGLGVRQHTETWTTTLKIRTGSAFAMLWAGVATEEQAKKMADRYLADGSDLYCDWGVRSLSKRHRLFNNIGVTDPLNIPAEARRAGFVPLAPLPSGNPSNWQGPVWIINNYFLFRGLMNYDLRSYARRLFDQTRLLLTRDIETTGTSHENYHSESGKGLAHTDFMCWNLTVFAMEHQLLGEPSVEDYLEQ